MDGSDIDCLDDEIYQLVKDKNTLTVLNKTDKGEFYDDRAEILVSALKKENLNDLRAKIFERTVGANLDLNGDFLCEERHFDALSRALERLISAENNANSVSLDILAIDIKDAWDALGEISGKTATEDIIDNIFSKFCVGK
jgi:tRNA modification GTPase